MGGARPGRLLYANAADQRRAADRGGGAVPAGAAPRLSRRGVLLLWLGAGLSAENWIAATTIMVFMVGAYARRIQTEEAMLAATFGDDYTRYSGRTWRLIPFVY
jgi:hypothetical protein